MGSFGNYLENELLDHLFGKGAYTPPTIHLALSTADPTDDGSGIAEPVGNNYSRKQTAAADWTPASGGALSNANELAFAVATGGWGLISHFAAFDQASGGNMLMHGVLSVAKNVLTGQTARFPVGDIDASLD